MSVPINPTILDATLSTRHARGVPDWRESGQGSALVLLHGIGSGSLSWAGQLQAFGARARVVAWDAPGYGASAALAVRRPLAHDYAASLTQLLDHLDIDRAIVVGHSLGAIVAAAWAVSAPERVRALVLASPARGYARERSEVREAKWRERIDLVQRLGIEGMAEQRSAQLCSRAASDAAREMVHWNMARVTAGGYAQAAHMLAHDDLLTHAKRVRAPMAVLCGDADTVTPPEACETLARELDAPFTTLRGVAHACYVEDADQFNATLAHVLDGLLETGHEPA